MPTERFLNLPADKRQRILQATAQELSHVPFDELSINRIIQTAGIPRGSFYQYFDDKSDLVSYLLCGYGQEIRQKLLDHMSREMTDIFTLCRLAMHYTVEFLEREGNYDFCRNAISVCRIDGTNAFGLFEMNPDILIESFSSAVDHSALRLNGQQGLHDLLEILVLLFRRAMVRLVSHPGQSKDVQESFFRQLDMVRFGVSAEGGMANGEV